MLENGEGFSRRFDEPGRYPFHCTPHPFMKGVVIVAEPT
ncbi:MAG: plastocyanin/azurin family copper-binding protein [Gemmatimonadota bacterium]